MLATAKQACKLFRASGQFQNCLRAWSTNTYKVGAPFQRPGFWAECARQYMGESFANASVDYISEEEKLKFDVALRKKLFDGVI
jgi:hypothetical protein